MLQLLHDLVVGFKGSILGFEEFDEFKLSVLDAESPYIYLQSVQNENLGFLVVTPFVFYPEYTFEIEENDKTILGIESQEDVVVLNMLTLKDDFTKSTVNLLAPLILNIRLKQARQIVLPPKTDYVTTMPLFRDSLPGSGE